MQLSLFFLNLIKRNVIIKLNNVCTKTSIYAISCGSPAKRQEKFNKYLKCPKQENWYQVISNKHNKTLY